jgi:hypothetical protein
VQAIQMIFKNQKLTWIIYWHYQKYCSSQMHQLIFINRQIKKFYSTGHMNISFQKSTFQKKLSASEKKFLVHHKRPFFGLSLLVPWLWHEATHFEKVQWGSVTRQMAVPVPSISCCVFKPPKFILLNTECTSF